MRTTSKILIVMLGSLHQIEGGEHEYNYADSILSRLPPDSQNLLIETRAKAFRWLKDDKTATWQGIPISEHEYNKNLVRGHDFGGNDERAVYYPALRRFEGRFFLTLGLEGKRAMYLSQHHVLLVCGLYGLLTLMEPIQRYNCPVETNLKNFDIWTEDNTLTDILLDYIREHGIVRAFDLTATEPRRRLISWPSVHNELGGNVLHYFSTTAAGDDALIPFGQAITKYLLNAPAEKLLTIKPETEEGEIIFREMDGPRSGMPHEAELRAWGQADEIERKRRGVIRFLDKTEKSRASRIESTGGRVARLVQKGKIDRHEEHAMRVIMNWRNQIVYKQHYPNATELGYIEEAWEHLTNCVNKHRWQIDEFQKA